MEDDNRLVLADSKILPIVVFTALTLGHSLGHAAVDPGDGVAVPVLELSRQGQSDFQQDTGLGDGAAGCLHFLVVAVIDFFFQCALQEQGEIAAAHALQVFYRFCPNLIFLLLVDGKGKLHSTSAVYMSLVGFGIHLVVSVFKHGIQLAHHNVGASRGHFHYGVGKAGRQGKVAHFIRPGDFHHAGDSLLSTGDHQIVNSGQQVGKAVNTIGIGTCLSQLVGAQP